jgi:surfeit locus 1 family protein
MKSSRALRAALGAVWLLVIAGLLALGTWQVQRRAWKLDLIARVDARLHAAPEPAPFGKAIGKQDEYRRVMATGRFVPGKDALVQASTVRGPGWWVMTPLSTQRGAVLVNRGYVADRRAPAPPAGKVMVVGLLRLTEPGGGFLRSNDPAAGRWYSRDVAAIARRNGLELEPYFIDAEAGAERPGQPIGGLTVVTFTNNHLAYALTWYTLAMMTAAAFFYWVRPSRPARSKA